MQDRGRTWHTWTPAADTVPGEGPLSFGECHGPIELPSGELVVHMARTLAGRSYEWDAWLLRSHDGGETWGDCTRVPTHTDSDEISYEYLPVSHAICRSGPHFQRPSDERAGRRAAVCLG